MPCLMSKDQPLRVKLSKTGVVHAGDYNTWGGYSQWSSRDGKKYIPKRKGIRIACSWKEVSLNKEVSKREKITCKNCQKAMGMVEGPVFPDRFVIRRKDTGEFYKNTRSRCTVWADDVVDAWFWKRKGDAKRVCKRVRWLDADGNIVERPPYRQQGRLKREVYYDPNLEIKKVRIDLED